MSEYIVYRQNNFPAVVVEEDWPEVARQEWTNGYTATVTGYLEIRQHADGRWIVQGYNTHRNSKPVGVIVTIERISAFGLGHDVFQICSALGIPHHVGQDLLNDCPPEVVS